MISQNVDKSLSESPPTANPQTASPRLFVRLLGEPSVKTGHTWHPFISDRRYQVLAYLAQSGTWVTRDKLADLFYSDTNQSAARSNLRKIFFKIKNLEWLAAPDVIAQLEYNDEAVRWQVETDVHEFLAAIETNDWERALKRYSGSFLQGFTESDSDFDGWVETERLRLAELYQHASEKYIYTLEQRGDTEAALFFLRQLLARDPLLESVHREIIRLEFKRGNSEAAFEQFERCREVLQKELGVEPEEETLELLRKLEQGTTSAKFAVLLKNPDSVPDAPQTLFGREKILEDITHFLQQGERVLAQGFGGMGKTALAATLAKTFLLETKKNVLWLQVGADNPDVILEALARPFDAQQELSKAQDKPAFLKSTLQAQNLSLVVLDDVWNAYSLSKALESIPQGLPLLVTSRQRYPRIKRIYVDRLERTAAIELLKHYASPLPSSSFSPLLDSGMEEEKRGRGAEEVNDLCQLLGDHPFTLRIAGLNLREGSSVPELLERIKNAPHDLKIPSDFKEAGRESAASLLSASLEPLSDLEYELFMSYGILASPVATPQLLSECSSRALTQVEEALFNLVSRGLAERVSKPNSDYVAYRLHDLAHSYACTNRIQRHSTLIRAGLSHLREHKHDVTLLELDIANLLSAAELCQEQKREDDLLSIMYLLTVEGSYYTARGHNSRSVGMLKEVAEVAEEKGRLEEAHYLYTKLGEYYFNFLGNYPLALENYEYAQNLAAKWGNKPREAISLGLMAFARFHQGKSDEEDFSSRAYDFAKLTDDDECLVQVLGQLAYIAINKGNLEKANKILRESIEVSNKLLLTQSSHTQINKIHFFNLLNLGETEYRLGRFDDGVLVRKQALELATDQKNEVWMGYAHYELGEMHHNVNQRDIAKQHMLEALQLFQNNNCTKDVGAVLSFLKAGDYSL
jgi:DNA-binding SARP family transcriptional activator